MIFNSSIKCGATLGGATVEEIKSEPMLFRATLPFAVENGGPLTRNFLAHLNASGPRWQGDMVIDSRVHMLMPGMWPCIPGWHHDDIPRTRSDRQPNYETPEYHSDHCMAIWGDCSHTEFALGVADIPIPPVGTKVYKFIDPLVEAACITGSLERFFAPERTLVFFDCDSWHRGSEATHRGFRFFIRATRGTNIKPANETRLNANVYMPVMEEGW